MNKLIVALIPIALAIVCASSVIYWNMQKGCEVYGGVVGQSQKCSCAGIIIQKNPIDSIKFQESAINREFSSNFCLGIMTEVKTRPF